MNNKDLSVSVKTAGLLEAKIKAGDFGKPGDFFMKTDELSKYAGVSLVTAQKIMVILRERGLLKLIARKHYILYERIKKDTKLYTLRKSSKLIGLHLSAIDNPYFSALAAKISEYAQSIGYQLLIKSSNKNRDEERRIMEFFFDLNVLGILTAPERKYSLALDYYENYPLPLVILSTYFNSAKCSSVLVDNYKAANIVAEHFISNGYQNFAYVGSALSRHADLRLLGYADRLKERGFDLDEKDIFSVPAINYEYNSQFKNFLYKRKKPLAVFCYHDLLALQIHNAANQLGFDIPKEVGIVGFDNLDIGKCLYPQLSSVYYPLDDMAKRAINLLLAIVQQPGKKPETAYVEPALFARKSSLPHQPSHR